MEWIMAEAAPDARGAFTFAVSRYVLQIVSLYIVFDDNFPIIHKRALIFCFPGQVAKPAHLQLSKRALFVQTPNLFKRFAVPNFINALFIHIPQYASPLLVI